MMVETSALSSFARYEIWTVIIMLPTNSLLKLVMVNLMKLLLTTHSNLVEELGEEAIHPQDKLLPFVSIEEHTEPLNCNSPDY
jgi:hypothetical protein